MLGKVEKTLNKQWKTGHSDKTGKDWVMQQIQLEDGRTATGFDDVADGEEVELSQRGEYWNYKKLTQQTRDNETIRTELSMLRNDLMAALGRVEHKLEVLVQEDMKEQFKPATEPLKQPDVVLPEDEPLTAEDMKDLPF